MKNLIYLEINYSKNELNLFGLFLKSIKLTLDGKPPNFELLLITNYKYRERLEKFVSTVNIKGLRVMFHFVPKDITFEKASLRVLDIFEFKDIMKYDKVLHVRCDTLFIRIPAVLFDVHIKHNRIYSYNESMDKAPWIGYDHNSPFYGFQDYTEEDLLYFKKNYIRTWTSSVFMFKPDAQMMEHFKNVKALADIRAGTGVFSDQCYLNYYFNSLKLSDTKKLEGFIESRNIKTNFEGKPTVTDTSYDVRVALVNFCGLSYFEEKIIRMQRYINMMLEMKPCATKVRKIQTAY